MRKINFVAIVSALLSLASSVWGADYVAVAKEGKVFDDPSPKYVTLNEKNVEVIVSPGMAFKTSEHLPGWYLIEYSPGLRGYLQEQTVSTSVSQPMAGTYEIKNNPGHKITIQKQGDNWTASSEGKTYNGTNNEDIVVFMDNQGNIAFSLVDLGDGPVVMTYENSITEFF